MPNADRKLTIEVSFLVDPAMDNHLQEMVAASDMNKSQLLRGLVRAAYKMRVEGQPVCANSEGCRAPQLFMGFVAPNPAAPQSRADPDTHRTLVRQDVESR